MIDEALERGLNQGRTVLKNLPHDCTVTIFEQQLFQEKASLILVQIYSMLGCCKVSSIIWFYVQIWKNMLRFATDSEIMSVTRPHTICWCCAHHCSIPVKNVIYSYLFITEKQSWGARSRLRGLPLPSHTQWNRPKQKILVVNRLEAADCEEWFSVCVSVCAHVCVSFLNEWRHESGNRTCVFLCAHARGQIIDSYFRNGDSLSLFVCI